MVFDQGLAFRIDEILTDFPGLITKKMFGGVGYLINGNMACGVSQSALIVRLPVEDYPTALQKPFTRKFDMTGKEMRGWIFVDPEGIEDDSDLQAWVQIGVKYAASLPPK